ncbi:hypothetical protein P154DRAFT_517140 [Amniculicola lignicola CBS 123094]|uniref:Uncharacterized protein n=1 Tax=Amniculicola lignicola CBS 123094 TaxID=1392246 RepID=A0A6A5X3D0_9PLEO|nr:hypothetical protein P154DRAFT_517140 [Amniculicola lignicola CBS 123094]
MEIELPVFFRRRDNYIIQFLVGFPTEPGLMDEQVAERKRQYEEKRANKEQREVSDKEWLDKDEEKLVEDKDEEEEDSDEDSDPDDLYSRNLKENLSGHFHINMGIFVDAFGALPKLPQLEGKQEFDSDFETFESVDSDEYETVWLFVTNIEHLCS